MYTCALGKFSEIKYSCKCRIVDEMVQQNKMLWFEIILMRSRFKLSRLFFTRYATFMRYFWYKDIRAFDEISISLYWMLLNETRSIVWFERFEYILYIVTWQTLQCQSIDVNWAKKMLFSEFNNFSLFKSFNMIKFVHIKKNDFKRKYNIANRS